MKGYDIIGNIAVVKFDFKDSNIKKKRDAEKLMRENKSIRTVLEKAHKFSGRLRTIKTKFIAGENTKEVLYRENGCEFRFNLETCYFSPRLASERAEIANIVKKGEKVLVLFAGVAPFSIAIAKTGKPKRVVSVELGRECSKYALENARRNKLAKEVEIVQGDVRRVLPKMKKKKEKFSRIVMARPNLKDSFLDVTFPLIAKGGIMHYYGFYRESEVDNLRALILEEAKKAKKKIKILKIKKAGEIGVKAYRYRVDIRVLN